MSICRTFGFIRKGKVTDAARFDGKMLREVVTSDNTASDVWADTAYRSQANEAWLKRQSRVSRIHRRKPRGKPMPERTAKSNAAKSKVRAYVEHVFARQAGHRNNLRWHGLCQRRAKGCGKGKAGERSGSEHRGTSCAQVYGAAARAGITVTSTAGQWWAGSGRAS